VKLVFGTECW